MSSTIVEFYFDPVSPYSWLAMEQIDRIIEAGALIACRPILFAALLNAHATKGPAEVPAKRAYVFRDVMRQAAQLKLPFRGPPYHPFNPLSVLRALHAIEDDTHRLKAARKLLSAIWRDGVDIGDADALHAVLVDSGLDADAVRHASETTEIKLRLRNATGEAINAGIFGVPTFRIDSELFWGADRLDDVIWALHGGSIDEAVYAKALARPAAVERHSLKQ